MNKLLYSKIAINNIKKNSKIYIPYILTCIITIAMFYVIFELANSPGIMKLPCASAMQSMMHSGTLIMGLFSMAFIFYTNSFLIKQRKKEFGLFNILGMEKRHIVKILFFENLYVSLGTLSLGIFLGLLLNKLMFLLLLKILKLRVKMGFQFSDLAIIGTIILFAIIFILVLLNTIRQIYKSKTIELIKGSNVGEREPKNKWIITIVGIIFLGTGYYISVTTTNPLKLINLFFVAVFFVCIGVYCLFTSGSITLLKALRKNKNYYYKTNHFISISTMIYRMKQNAFGLANICILSTAVLVIVSSTVALYIGLNDIIKSRYPREICIRLDKASNEGINKINTAVEKVLKNNNEKEKNIVKYKSKHGVINIEKTKFTVNNYKTLMGNGDINDLIVITLDEYNKAMNENKTLRDDEVLFYSNRKEYPYKYFSIDGKTFNIKEKLKEGIVNGMDSATILDTIYVIVKDDSVYKDIFKEINTEEYFYGFNLKGNESKYKVYNNLNKELSSDKNSFEIKIELLDKEKYDFYSIFGGLFFLGLFLGIVFIIATILIMYYKQISEGYNDKERYKIMQKVGLNKREIKSIINSQVLIVFFMPLVFAIINISFAFPSITRLLLALNFTNTRLYGMYTIITSLVFALCYGAVYLVTARIYYKIVK